MRKYSLSFKLAFVVSLSATVAFSSSPPLFDFHRFTSSLSSSSSQKSTASNLLSLLGSKDQASTINHKRAQDLQSCLKFLVPLSPPSPSHDKFLRISLGRRDLIDKEDDDDDRRRSNENEMVWWPPAPVMELALLAVDSGGDTAAIHQTLDPTMLTVPDVEGRKKDKCELTRTPHGWRFINKELNSYLAFLFEMIAARGPSVGLNVSLSRYDLFHGHLFLATDSGRLGILFHAKEYPMYDEEVFPINMGYCQKGSNVPYDESINLRNILWLAPLPNNVTKDWVAPGVLVVLDANPKGIIYKELVPEYVDFVRTIYEEDFGEVALDVNYFNVENAAACDKIFLT